MMINLLFKFFLKTPKYFLIIIYLVCFSLCAYSNQLISIGDFYNIDPDYLINIPLFDLDLRLLKRYQNYQKKLENGEIPYISLFELSGNATGQIVIPIQSESPVDIWTGELDLAMHANSWLTGFIGINYLESPLIFCHANTPDFRLDRGFITIGDLNQSPFFVTIGKRYLPFGQYTTLMIDPTLLQLIGNINPYSFLIGYQHTGDNGIYATAYSYYPKSMSTKLGATLGYQLKLGGWQVDVGGDYIEDITGSVALYDLFKFYGQSLLLPAFDTHLKITSKRYLILFEYLKTIKPSKFYILQNNNYKIQPSAYDFELGYKFNLYKKSAFIALGYGETYETTVLKIPAKKLLADLNIMFTKHIILSTQISHIFKSNIQTHDENIITAKLNIFF